MLTTLVSRLISSMVLLFFLICLGALPLFAQKSNKIREKHSECIYWQSVIDDTIESSELGKQLNTSDPKTILTGIECLLKMEGNKHKARFSGATKVYVSQIFEPATVEVAALYYISYLFYQKWDHADAIALRDERGNVNTLEAIHKAYSYYREWFKEVKKRGFDNAIKEGLDPLKGKDVRWY
jgi:hypothetical protein